jgi:hypothetical protein
MPLLAGISRQPIKDANSTDRRYTVGRSRTFIPASVLYVRNIRTVTVAEGSPRPRRAESVGLT